MSSIGQVRLVPWCVGLRYSFPYQAASFEVALVEATDVVEGVEAVCPSRKTRHCGKTLLWLTFYCVQGSPGMVKVAV